MKETDSERETILQFVSFRVADEEFAIPIHAVREINRLLEITRVPHSPEFVEGVVNLRGQVVPVLNLRTRLGLPSWEWDRDTWIIVVESKGAVAGIIVDRVSEVLRVPRGMIEPPPPAVGSVERNYIESVVKFDNRLLVLLALDKLLKEG